jgi:hypothetical protein
METELPPQVKVQILLAEYATLRTEIIQRIGHQMQLLAVGGVMFLWLVSRGKFDAAFWCSLVAFVSVVLIFGYFLRRDITHAAERVAQLEVDVNRRAGEKLLVWENEWGGHKTGFWGPRPTPSA